MPVFIIARGPDYHREGIDDIGDIYNVIESDEKPSGPGYALADITEISILSKNEVMAILNAKTPETIIDNKDDKEYWYDGVDRNWYEIIVKPKYALNLSRFTIEDKATLKNQSSSSDAQVTILNKIEANILKYSVNKQIIRSED